MRKMSGGRLSEKLGQHRQGKESTMDRVKKESKDDGTALYEQLLPSLRFKKGDEQLTIENRPSSFSSRAMDPPPTDPTRSPFVEGLEDGDEDDASSGRPSRPQSLTPSPSTSTRNGLDEGVEEVLGWRTDPNYMVSSSVPVPSSSPSIPNRSSSALLAKLANRLASTPTPLSTGSAVGDSPRQGQGNSASVIAAVKGIPAAAGTTPGFPAGDHPSWLTQVRGRIAKTVEEKYSEYKQDKKSSHQQQQGTASEGMSHSLSEGSSLCDAGFFSGSVTSSESAGGDSSDQALGIMGPASLGTFPQETTTTGTGAANCGLADDLEVVAGSHGSPTHIRRRFTFGFQSLRSSPAKPDQQVVTKALETSDQQQPASLPPSNYDNNVPPSSSSPPLNQAATTPTKGSFRTRMWNLVGKSPHIPSNMSATDNNQLMSVSMRELGAATTHAAAAAGGGGVQYYNSPEVEDPFSSASGGLDLSGICMVSSRNDEDSDVETAVEADEGMVFDPSMSGADPEEEVALNPGDRPPASGLDPHQSRCDEDQGSPADWGTWWLGVVAPLSFLALVQLLPLPGWVLGFITGIFLGSLAAAGLAWYLLILGESSSPGPKFVENIRRKTVRKPAIIVQEEVQRYYVWMNLWPSRRGPYDPLTYDVRRTGSVRLMLHGPWVEMRFPKRNMPLRRMYDDVEPKKVEFHSHVEVLDLSNCLIDLLPENLPAKRMWSKKYPIRIRTNAKRLRSGRSSAKAKSPTVPETTSISSPKAADNDDLQLQEAAAATSDSRDAMVAAPSSDASSVKDTDTATITCSSDRDPKLCSEETSDSAVQDEPVCKTRRGSAPEISPTEPAPPLALKSQSRSIEAETLADPEDPSSGTSASVALLENEPSEEAAAEPSQGSTPEAAAASKEIVDDDAKNGTSTRGKVTGNKAKAAASSTSRTASDLAEDEEVNKTFYLFARTGREKEEWYNRFLAGSRFMRDWEHQNPKRGEKPDPDYETTKVKEQKFNVFMEDYLQAREEESAGKTRENRSGDAKDEDDVDRQQPQQEDSAGLQHSKEQQLAFLNIFFARMWHDLHDNSTFIEYLREKITRKLLKVKIAHYFNDVKVTALDLGPRLPQIQSVSLPWQDEMGLWVDLDIEYNGICQATVETQGIRLPGKDEPDREAQELARLYSRQAATLDSDEEDSAEEDEDVPENDDNDLTCDLQPHAGFRARMLDSLLKSDFVAKVAETEWVKKNITSKNITLQLQLHHVKGTLTLNFPPAPSDRVWYGFKRPPTLDIALRPCFGSLNLGRYENTLSAIMRHLVKRLKMEFMKVLVYPNMDDEVLPFMNHVKYTAGSPLHQQKSG